MKNFSSTIISRKVLNVKIIIKNEFDMQKLLILLLLSFFSNQSLANLSVYSCEIKQNLQIYDDEIYDVSKYPAWGVYDPSSFLFKVENKKLIFDKDISKRPRIITYHEVYTTYSDESEYGITILADDALKHQYNFMFNKEDDYGYLAITGSYDFGIINNLIAKCIAL